MGKRQIIRTRQTSFLSGQLDPKLKARTDLAAYFEGAEFMRNVTVSPQGGFTRRPGTAHVAEMQDPVEKIDSAGWTVTCPRGGTPANLIDNDGTTKVITTTAVGTINPYIVFHIDMAVPTLVEFCDVEDVRLVGANSLAEFRMQYSTDDVVWVDQPSAGDIPINNLGDRKTTRRWGEGNGAGVSARYWRFVRVGATDHGSATVEVSEFEAWAVEAGTITSNPHRVIDFEASNASLFTVVLTSRNAAVFKRDDSSGVPVFTKVDNVFCRYNKAELPDISWFQAQDVLFLFHEDHRPQQVKRTTVDTSWERDSWAPRKFPLFPFEDLLNPQFNGLVLAAKTGRHVICTATSAVFTSAMLGWGIEAENGTGYGIINKFTSSTVVEIDIQVEFSRVDFLAWNLFEPAWSQDRGWPRCGVYGNGRFWLGGTVSIPNGVWASKSALISNFDDSEAKDNSAMTLIVDTENTPRVYQIFNGLHIQVFTSRGVFYYAPTDGALVPTNVSRRVAARMGAKGPGVPVMAGDKGTFFVQRGGKLIRELNFTDLSNPYDPGNLSLFVPELTRDPVDAALRRSIDGDEVSYYALVNSSAATISVAQFLSGQDFLAWSEWYFEGTPCAVSADIDYMYLGIERTINGVKKWYLERFDERHLMDGSVRTGPGVPADEVSGLPYPDGTVVGVYQDLIYKGTKEVLNGAVELDDDVVTEVEVGLLWPDITGRGDILHVKDMPAEDPGQPFFVRQSKKRVVRVDLLLHETQEIWVGANDQPPVDLIFRKFGTAVLDNPSPIVTGIFDQRGEEGSTTEGQVELTQRIPGPITVLGLYKELMVT